MADRSPYYWNRKQTNFRRKEQHHDSTGYERKQEDQEYARKHREYGRYKESHNSRHNEYRYQKEKASWEPETRTIRLRQPSNSHKNKIENQFGDLSNRKSNSSRETNTREKNHKEKTSEMKQLKEIEITRENSRENSRET